MQAHRATGRFSTCLTTLLFLLAVSLATGRPAAETAALAAAPTPDKDDPIRLASVEPTVFFVQRDSSLLQKADLIIENSGNPVAVDIEIRLQGTTPASATNVSLASGRNTVSLYVPDITQPTPAEITLRTAGREVTRQSTIWQPQRHWEVYLTPISHHDWGYTQPIEAVLQQYDGIYDDVLRFCDETSDWPQESKFHYMIEGSWSIQHYIENRPKEVIDKLARYARDGRIEIAALFGNQITGLCGHEELVRMMYPSFRAKRQLGTTIRSAHITDIPGLSWALPTLLAEVGVKYFFAGLPTYFEWEGRRVPTFWDESAIVRHGRPEAFRWEGPDGRSVLVYYQGGYGCWGSRTYEKAVAELPDKLRTMEKDGSPFSVVRYGCSGCGDNTSPSLIECRTVGEWNDQWAYPRLIMATSSMFFEALEKQCQDVRVFRGELPHTDYAVGAASTARDTGVNRITHDLLPVAERYTTLTSLLGLRDRAYPAEWIRRAYDDMLMYDEHTWGMDRPAGLFQDWDYSDKSHAACRAAGLASSLVEVNTRWLAENVSRETDGVYLVVFNPLSTERTDVVRTSPRFWPSVPAFVRDRRFDLIDDQSGERVDHQWVDLADPLAPRPFAAQRYALGHITDQTEDPARSMRADDLHELVFAARNVPSVGYKTYRVVERQDVAGSASDLRADGITLENRFYRIRLDPKTGGLAGLFDKEFKTELADEQAAHRINQFIVRWVKDYRQEVATQVRVEKGAAGPVYASLLVRAQAPGCPQLTQEIVLYRDIKRIEFNNRILKDSTPLMEAYFAFPFKLREPRFRFEGSNSVIEPFRDQFPGSNSNYYSVQHWASVGNGELGVTLSPIEAHLMEFGGLWTCRVSQAHHGTTPPGFEESFIRPEQMSKAHIYSFVLDSNFRTNFQPVQQGDMLFRYALTSHRGDWRTGLSRDFGWAAANPLVGVAVNGVKKSPYGRNVSFCQVQADNVFLLAMKQAEDGRGLILRLIETQGQKTEVALQLPRFAIAQAIRTNLVEEDQEGLTATEHEVRVSLRPFGLQTVRLLLKQDSSRHPAAETRRAP